MVIKLLGFFFLNNKIFYLNLVFNVVDFLGINCEY